MSQTVQRQTNQMPAWLMSRGAVVGIVGAILKKHAEKIRELIGLQRRPSQTARRAALAALVAREVHQGTRATVGSASAPVADARA